MSAFALGKWALLFDNWRIFANGVLYTLMYSVLGLIVALVSGLALALFSVTGNRFLIIFRKVIVRLAQNIPQVIMIFFMYNVFPLIGIRMSVFQIGIFGVGIYQGAFISETFRSGILAIPKGQWEAADSQGFTRVQMLRLIILPQMFHAVLPALTNNMVNFIKNTSVLGMIAGGEIMYVADSWSSVTMAYVPAYFFTALVYFLICFPLSTFAKKLERSKNKGGVTV